MPFHGGIPEFDAAIHFLILHYHLFFAPNLGEAFESHLKLIFEDGLHLWVSCLDQERLQVIVLFIRLVALWSLVIILYFASDVWHFLSRFLMYSYVLTSAYFLKWLSFLLFKFLIDFKIKLLKRNFHFYFNLICT